MFLQKRPVPGGAILLNIILLIQLPFNDSEYQKQHHQEFDINSRITLKTTKK